MNHDTQPNRQEYLTQLSQITNILRDTIKEMTEEQLEQSYREEGWSARQIIHHMADNDMNAYIRLKRALTEDEPLAASYREDLWAELNDYSDTPIETSIVLMECIHMRMMNLIRGLEEEDYAKMLTTAVLGKITVDTAIQRFIWHNHHHISHLKQIMK